MFITHEDTWDAQTFLGTLNTGRKGIFERTISGGFKEITGIGDAVAGLSGATVGSLKDPVVSSDGSRRGWDGTIKVSGIVDATNDVGVWAMDSTGALRLLFREGDMIEGRQLKSFTVLKAVPGSPGVTHAFNDAGQVAWRATFIDGTTAVMVTQVP